MVRRRVMPRSIRSTSRFDARRVAEQAARLRLGLLARESALHELVDAALNMKGELGVDVGLDAHPSERNPEDALEAAPVVGAQTRSFRGDHQSDGLGVVRPLGELCGELSSSGCGEAIRISLSRSAIGVAPLCVEPAFLFEAVERGIEGAFFDLELLVGGTLDPLERGQPVQFRPQESVLRRSRSSVPLMRSRSGAGGTVSPNLRILG